MALGQRVSLIKHKFDLIRLGFNRINILHISFRPILI
jgi:hypothetical protein